MNASEKAAKLLALAAPGSGASPHEAATARELAAQICSKFGVLPANNPASSSLSVHSLPGNVQSNWRPSRPPTEPWRPPANPFLIAPESNLSGISTQEARRMALEILDAQQNGQCYLEADDEDLIRQAFDGLLTEYGKILLMGMHAVVVE